MVEFNQLFCPIALRTLYFWIPILLLVEILKVVSDPKVNCAKDQPCPFIVMLTSKFDCESNACPSLISVNSTGTVKVVE